MMDGETGEDPTLFPTTVGEKLRGAREAQGLELAEIAARTRIPQRHLEAIEKSDYVGLPSVTYSLGFAKSYARALGLDEVEIARDLREELGNSPERAAPTPSYELEDPSRVPPRGLAWAGLIIAVLALIGVALWYGTGLFRGSAPAPETLPVATDNAVAETPGTATAVGDGHVTLVALDLVWVRVTDAKGQKLFEKEMIPGERYDVPIDADHPKARTGGPEKLQVLLNGSNVAALGPAGQTVDVELTAAALQARGESATPSPSPSAESNRPVARPAARRRPSPSPSASAAEPVAATSNSGEAP
jgi:cytoskeleton protein RodZ